MINIELKELLLKPFAPLFKFRYLNVLSGGKGAGKSHQVATFLILKLLMNTKRNIMVVSKHIKTNTDTTYPSLRSAITRLSREIEGLDKAFKMTMNPLRITFIPTGQIIKFASFEKIDTTSSIATDDPDTYFDTIWFEELISVNDTFKEGEIGVSEVAINTMINSTLRFDPNNIHHKGAIPQVIFSNNPWRNEYWLIKKYLDKYLPNSKCIKDLKKKGYKTYENKEKNIFISRTNVLCNHFASPIQKETLKNSDWENDVETIMITGLTFNLGGEFLAPVINLLRVEEVQGHNYYMSPKFKILASGVDIGLSEKGDATTCYLSASSINDNRQPNYKYLHILDEFYHSNRSGAIMNPREIASRIVFKHWEWKELYPEIISLRLTCYVDASDIAFIDTLIVQQKELDLKGVHTSSWLTFRPLKEKWNKDNRVGNRYLFLREMIGKQRLIISPKCKMLINDLPQLPANPTKQTKRRHSDDTIDGMFYSFLIYTFLFSNNNQLQI